MRKSVIAPDTNFLLYAYNRNDPVHFPAKAYWQAALQATEAIGIPVICVHGFIRIATSTSFGTARLDPDVAIGIVNGWMSHSQVSILHPGPDHWNILQKIAVQGAATSRIFTDASIAAIAIEHGAVIHTHDRDFARFPNLRWHNPLQP
jgi:toxin-antitoxin system PIN domain toxin